jgi:DNA sulfur modification protein DndC
MKNAPSFHEDPLVSKTREEILDLYQRDDRPWVIAFSGGKDSSALLQLVVETLSEATFNSLKPVYVISSDTLVEAPNVGAYLSKTIDRLKDFARQTAFPLEVKLVRPPVEQTFWSKLIGQGYPSPTRWFRWCTSNMKIKPSRVEIDQITRKHGSVILLLGTRSSESSSRSSRIKSRGVNSRGLNPHHEIPNALVATPIVEWTNDQVWGYLSVNDPPPWGGSNEFLTELYHQAGAADCPPVLDISTPPCGKSRFGCWTCTVVKEDRSMKGFIQNGEERFAPLNRFRDRLKEVREREDWRMDRRKNGEPGPGPFRPQRRLQLLDELLALEKEVGQQLISDEEINFIQRQWEQEFDLKESAFSIAAKHGRHVGKMEIALLPSTEQKVLDELVVEYGIAPDLVDKLLRLVMVDYPDLGVRGAKISLERDMEEVIVSYVNSLISVEE